MYCKNCGAVIARNQTNCSICGAKAPPEDKRPDYIPAQQTYPPKTDMSMIWYTILIYVLLFFFAAVYVLYGVSRLVECYFGTGEYSRYAELKTYGMASGIAMLLFALFIVYTRFRLARYRKHSINLLALVCVIPPALELSDTVAWIAIYRLHEVKLMFGSEYYIGLVLSVMLGMAALIANLAYFGNRKELFVF
mgnify:CR=1 FL=1